MPDQLSMLPKPEEKRCIDCSEVKPLDQFPPARKRSDGRNSYCRACMGVRSKASYRKRVEAAGGTVREKRTDGLKQCNDCKLVLPLDAFPRNKNTSNGRHSYCKDCHNARGRESIERLYGNTRNYHLQGRYGITADQADAMVVAQGGLCAVCREQAAVHVDHDHMFGNVRGLTCFNCNGGLGQFKDRVDIMAKAIDYLERTTWQRTLVSAGVYQLTSPRKEAASPPSSELQRLISSRRG